MRIEQCIGCGDPACLPCRAEGYGELLAAVREYLNAQREVQEIEADVDCEEDEICDELCDAKRRLDDAEDKLRALVAEGHGKE